MLSQENQEKHTPSSRDSLLEKEKHCRMKENSKQILADISIVGLIFHAKFTWKLTAESTYNKMWYKVLTNSSMC